MLGGRAHRYRNLAAAVDSLGDGVPHKGAPAQTNIQIYSQVRSSRVNATCTDGASTSATSLTKPVTGNHAHMRMGAGVYLVR